MTSALSFLLSEQGDDINIVLFLLPEKDGNQ